MSEVQAAATIGEQTGLANPLKWLLDWGGGRITRSGQSVGEGSALTLPTYYAIVRNISEDVAKLPCPVYRESGRGRDAVRTHPAHRLLNRRPNPEMSAMAFRELLTSWAISHGTGYAEIVRKAGEPDALWPIHPSRVELERDEADNLWFRVTGNTLDDAYREMDSDVWIPLRDMLVIRGFGGNGITGYSLIRVAAETIGLGLALQAYGAGFFGGSTAINSLLTASQGLTNEQIDLVRTQWAERYTGPNANQKPAILPPGWDFKRVDIAPEEAQAIESRKFQVEDVARLARMPLSKLGAGVAANGERESLDYATDTIQPWAVRWEQEIDEKLLDGDGEYLAEHDLRELMRGDHAARSNYYSTMLAKGVITINEAREREKYNPVEGGDTHFVAMNQVPLESAKDYADVQIKKQLEANEGTKKNPTDQGGGANKEPDDNSSIGRQTPGQSAAEMGAIASGFFAPITQMLASKEAKAFERHAKGDAKAFGVWASGFYAEMATWAVEALTGPMASYSRLIGRPCVFDAKAWSATQKRTAVEAYNNDTVAAHVAYLTTEYGPAMAKMLTEANQ